MSNFLNQASYLINQPEVQNPVEKILTPINQNFILSI